MCYIKNLTRSEIMIVTAQLSPPHIPTHIYIHTVYSFISLSLYLMQVAS